MQELLGGLFHWTAFHPRIRHEVSSYYLGGNDATLIDPMLPEEGLEWFQDREPPRRIVLTNRHHYRQSGKFVDAFGCPVLCHETGLHEFEDGPEVEGFSFGERLSDAITALEMDAICPDDSVLHIALGDGLLAFADGLIRYGSPGFVSDGLMGDDPEAVKRGLRESLRALLDQDFDSLLFAHGRPLLGGGKQALREFLGA